MTSKNESYVVRKPLYETFPEVKGRQAPMTYMSGRQVPGARHHIRLGWVHGIPDPNPHVYEHTHDKDQLVHYWGGNPAAPQVLGGEIEFYIGGQPVTFNTTTCFFIPAGTPHGPITWKKFEFPHVEMVLTLDDGQAAESAEKDGAFRPKDSLPRKTNDFDYEQYAVRSPMREAAIGFKGLQSPSMTYMSRIQVSRANLYIDWAWVYGIVEPVIGEHMHRHNDEIVLHLGGDPAAPEDLGADMEYGVGGDPLDFSTSYGVFLPAGLRHGPLVWKRVRKPHVEMAIVFGVGTFQERSDGSTRLSGLYPLS
jgi:hypothetical protein